MIPVTAKTTAFSFLPYRGYRMWLAGVVLALRFRLKAYRNDIDFTWV